MTALVIDNPEKWRDADGIIIDRSFCKPLLDEEIKTLSEQSLRNYQMQPIGFPGNNKYRRMHLLVSHSLIWDEYDTRAFRKWAFDLKWSGIVKAAGYPEFKDCLMVELGPHNMTPTELNRFEIKIRSYVRGWVSKCVKAGTASIIKPSRGPFARLEIVNFKVLEVPGPDGFAVIDNSEGIEDENTEISDKALVEAAIESLTRLRQRNFLLSIQTAAQFMAESAIEEIQGAASSSTEDNMS
ncbi:hypothetical protein TWF281_006784 [Arthrobotrys megalospora]